MEDWKEWRGRGTGSELGMEVLISSSSGLAAFHFLARDPHGRRLPTLAARLHLPRSSSRTLFDVSRQRLLRVRAASRVALLGNSSEISRRVLSTWSDKDLAKAVLWSFVGRGGGGAGATTGLDHIVDLLASKLQPLRESENPAGRQFTVLQFEDALTPYLDSLLKEHRDGVCIDVVKNPPGPLAGSEVASPTLLFRKHIIAKLDRLLLKGILPPCVLDLMCFGLNLDQARKMVWKVPNITYLHLERKLASLDEFFLSLGMNHSDLPPLLLRSPQMLCVSIEKNLVPTVAFLENLCVDKSQVARMIRRYPCLLNLSRTKLEENVSYFLNEGISTVCMGKMVTQFPQILGIRITKIKLTHEFFLDKGFTKEEVMLMSVRFPCLHALSLEESLVPKWEFFLVMGYPKSDLIKFPQYFGCSLKNRIMPRYKLAMQLGVQSTLNKLLSTPNNKIARYLEGRIRR